MTIIIIAAIIRMVQKAIRKPEDTQATTPDHGWTCSQEQYNTIVNEGSKIIENMFGDLLKPKEE